jgi:hypothetical protein
MRWSISKNKSPLRRERWTRTQKRVATGRCAAAGFPNSASQVKLKLPARSPVPFGCAGGTDVRLKIQKEAQDALRMCCCRLAAVADAASITAEFRALFTAYASLWSRVFGGEIPTT